LAHPVPSVQASRTSPRRLAAIDGCLRNICSVDGRATGESSASFPPSGEKYTWPAFSHAANDLPALSVKDAEAHGAGVQLPGTHSPRLKTFRPCFESEQRHIAMDGLCGGAEEDRQHAPRINKRSHARNNRKRPTQLEKRAIREKTFFRRPTSAPGKRGDDLRRAYLPRHAKRRTRCRSGRQRRRGRHRFPWRNGRDCAEVRKRKPESFSLAKNTGIESSCPSVFVAGPNQMA